MLHTTATLAPAPLRLACSRRVSLLSLKGMCAALPSASLWMTVPSVSRLLLMKEPSTRWPLLRVTRADSEPARSMRLR